MEKGMIYYITFAFYILSTTLTLTTVSSLIMFEAETVAGVCAYATLALTAYALFVIWTCRLLSRPSDLRNCLNNPWLKGLMELFFSVTSSTLMSGLTIVTDFLDQSLQNRPTQRNLLNVFFFMHFNGMALVAFAVGVCIRTGYEKFVVLFLVIQSFNYVTKIIEGSTMYWRANSVYILTGGSCLLHIVLYKIYYRAEEANNRAERQRERRRARRARRRQARRERGPQ